MGALSVQSDDGWAGTIPKDWVKPEQQNLVTLISEIDLAHLFGFSGIDRFTNG
jgi:hypothetical protein